MRKELTKEEAIGLLPDGELVHVFINGGFGLIGADWNREDIIDKINTADRTELAGPMARGTGHGLVIFPPNAKYQKICCSLKRTWKNWRNLTRRGVRNERYAMPNLRPNPSRLL